MGCEWGGDLLWQDSGLRIQIEAGLERDSDTRLIAEGLHCCIQKSELRGGGGGVVVIWRVEWGGEAAWAREGVHIIFLVDVSAGGGKQFYHRSVAILRRNKEWCRSVLRKINIKLLFV